MTTKLEAEEGPDVIVGPTFDMREPGAADDLWAWMLGQHVQVCLKGGIDCRSCQAARERGIPLPA